MSKSPLLDIKMAIKFYTETEVTFCKWRSLGLSFPSLEIINFFPPIILLQLSSHSRRTTRVSRMAPLGNQPFSRSQNHVMLEMENIERKINLVAFPFLLVLLHILASNFWVLLSPPCSLKDQLLLFSDSPTFFRINLHFFCLSSHDSSQDGWKLTSINTQ